MIWQTYIMQGGGYFIPSCGLALCAGYWSLISEYLDQESPGKSKLSNTVTKSLKKGMKRPVQPLLKHPKP